MSDILQIFLSDIHWSYGFLRKQLSIHEVLRMARFCVIPGSSGWERSCRRWTGNQGLSRDGSDNQKVRTNCSASRNRTLRLKPCFVKAVNICCWKVDIRREQTGCGNFIAGCADRINYPDIAFQGRAVHNGSIKVRIVCPADESGSFFIVRADFAVIHSVSAFRFLFSGI